MAYKSQRDIIRYVLTVTHCTLLAEKSISTLSIAKQSYGGIDELVNDDNELTMAHKSQRDIIRYILTLTRTSCGEEYIHALYF